MIGFNNGKFQKVDDMAIPITSMSVNRGYGAFEFFQVINNTPFCGDMHLERFKQSLKLLRLHIDYEEHLFDIVLQLINYNELDDFYFKMYALPHSADLSDTYASDLYIFPTLMPLFSRDIYCDGARLIMKQYERFMPQAKTTNYLAGQFWQYEMDREGAIDVLYYNGNTVQETSRGNVFMVKDGRVSTPYKNVLKGVTRAVVMDLLQTHSLPVDEDEITIDTLMAADEIFITSTTKQVVPIVYLDGVAIGEGIPGDVTKLVMKYFIELKNNYKKDIDK